MTYFHLLAINTLESELNDQQGTLSGNVELSMRVTFVDGSTGFGSADGAVGRSGTEYTVINEFGHVHTAYAFEMRPFLTHSKHA